MEGLNWQTLPVPFSSGLAQKSDDRARPSTALDIATDVQFDETGGLQTRYPFAALTGALADARRIVKYRDEFVVFTKDAIQTRFADQSSWTQQSTYLAAKVTETTRHITTGDQIHCDTARLSGMIVHVWAEGTSVYIATTDETTGAVTLSASGVTGSKPRVVALSTKILFFWRDGSGDLVVSSIDPAGDPADIPATIAAPTTVTAALDTMYDVTRLLTTDTAVFVARTSPSTSYILGTVTAGAVVSTTTKARDCDGACAVASTPDGTQVQVIRVNAIGAAVLGDFITISGFADVTTGQALGTAGATIEQVTAAYRSVTDGGFYRCYVFWSEDSGQETRLNYVDTNGTIGTARQLAAVLTLASRAFEYDGHVFVNLVFARPSSFAGGVYAQLQNTYFLYRAPTSTSTDPLLVAKMAATRAGGGLDAGDPLPGVQLTSGTTTFTWCGVERRVVPIGAAAGGANAYSDRGPRDITIEFDSNEARRTAILGETLYIASAEGVLQYDGRQLSEVGFHVYPYSFTGTETAGGSIATNGTYSYVMSYRWDNAKGERERSTVATIFNITLAAAPGGVTFAASSSLPVTHKITPGVVCEYWRTAINPIDGAPFFLVSSVDPTDTSNPNRFISNAPTAETLSTFNDELADTAITVLETFPENGAVLESIAPPAASIVIASDTRLFLAGIAGQPDSVWYSKLRGDGEVASFNDALVVSVPRAGGDITALGFLNETLIVFRETAIYALPGDGFDNIGGGTNMGPARLLSTDVGAVNHESVVFTPGGLVFKSSKGWYLLNRGWSLDYIGAAVTDYDSETPLAADLVEKQHQVRILTSSRMLVWDYLVQQWASWTIADGVHACLYGGAHHYLTTTAVKEQGTAYTALTYGLDVETAWIKPADLQGFSRVRKMLLLGEYRSAHRLRVRIAYDYNSTYVDDKYWTVSPTTVGGPLQLKIGPSRQQVQAIKIRLTATATATETPPTGEALKLTGLALEVGIKRNTYPRLPAAQRS